MMKGLSLLLLGVAGAQAQTVCEADINQSGVVDVEGVLPRLATVLTLALSPAYQREPRLRSARHDRRSAASPRPVRIRGMLIPPRLLPNLSHCPPAAATLPLPPAASQRVLRRLN